MFVQCIDMEFLCIAWSPEIFCCMYDIKTPTRLFDSLPAVLSLVSTIFDSNHVSHDILSQHFQVWIKLTLSQQVSCTSWRFQEWFIQVLGMNACPWKRRPLGHVLISTTWNVSRHCVSGMVLARHHDLISTACNHAFAHSKSAQNVSAYHQDIWLCDFWKVKVYD